MIDTFTKEKNISVMRSEEHTSELQSQSNLVCRLLLEKKKKNKIQHYRTRKKINTIRRIQTKHIAHEDTLVYNIHPRTMKLYRTVSLDVEISCAKAEV